jgi:TatD DNase family protein
METSQMSWIDTHCHLYATEFDGDRFEMVKRALDLGVNQMMMPNIDLETLPSMLSLAEQFPQHCKPMLGLHPCSVRENYRDILDQMKLEVWKGGYYGVGETGVDLYWDTKFKTIQIEAFETQIEWAKDLGLPVIIHSRESLELNINIIKNHQDGSLRGIFHCFGGSKEQAIRIHELGFKIGIGGIITFKKSELLELLPQLPLELIVLETDAPYLTPVPHRGKRNESSYLVLIAEKVAQSLKSSLEDVSLITIRNAEEVFGKKG